MKYEFMNSAEKATLKIYDYVGMYEKVNVSFIEDSLNEASGKPVDVYINSYGGEVFEGFAIYNILKRYTGYKTVVIDGIAASIASVIAMAGDKVVMNKASMMMIHNASGVCVGNAEDMRKVMESLEQINEVIRGIYQARTSLSNEELARLMDNETFMTADECQQYGFADEVVEDEIDDEAQKNYLNSLELLKNQISERINIMNSLKDVSQTGGETVSNEETFFNKKSHWAWLGKDK